MGFAEAQTRVADAAAWLDQTYPGWASRIDRGNFDMGDYLACIGSYLGVDWEQDLKRRYEDQTGFDAAGLFSSYDEEWHGEILARTGAPRKQKEVKHDQEGGET